MSAATPPRTFSAVDYPSSDGQPMAENTLQFEWIVALKGNLDLLFRDDPDVFVAGDHLIYPVEGDPTIRQAPDVYVAFGRPKGHRGSYKVFEEGGVFPQVIFEVWSPGNTADRMDDKRRFYEHHGAEEYYIVYPDFPAHLDGWLSDSGKFVRIELMNGHTSPRLGIRFEMGKGSIAVKMPDGRRLLSFVELGTIAEEAARLALQEKQRADIAAERADIQRGRADIAARRADIENQRADSAETRAEQQAQQTAKLAAKLRELGIDPDTL